MKKFITTACALGVCIVALAGGPLKVQSGSDNLKIISSYTMEVELVIDWSNASYDDRMTIEEQLGSEDTEWMKADCYTSFIEGFNETSWKVKLVDHETEYPYKYVINVDKIDSFFAAGRFIPRWEAKMWGTFYIVEKETGAQLVEVSIDEVEDGTDFVLKECFGDTFYNLGKMIGKLRK